MDEWSPFTAYAGRHVRHQSSGKIIWPWPDLFAAAVLVGGAIWCAMAARHLPGYDWQWPVLQDFLWRRDASGDWRSGLLLQGLFTTLRIGFWTTLFALVVGGWMGVATARKSFWGRWPLTLWINCLRNTPPLVLLFFVYFFAGNYLPIAALDNFIRGLDPLPQKLIGILVAQPGQMDRMVAAVLALGFYQAAYVAEITRGGIETIQRGQWDAAYALGFDRRATLFLVILPQALRIMLPALTSQIISIFKDSALASLISLPDLTFQSLEIMAVTGMTFEIWITTAVLYLLLGLLCAWTGNRLERKFTR